MTVLDSIFFAIFILSIIVSFAIFIVNLPFCFIPFFSWRIGNHCFSSRFMTACERNIESTLYIGIIEWCAIFCMSSIWYGAKISFPEIIHDIGRITHQNDGASSNIFVTSPISSFFPTGICTRHPIDISHSKTPPTEYVRGRNQILCVRGITSTNMILSLRVREIFWGLQLSSHLRLLFLMPSLLQSKYLWVVPTHFEP